MRLAKNRNGKSLLSNFKEAGRDDVDSILENASKVLAEEKQKKWKSVSASHHRNRLSVDRYITQSRERSEPFLVSCEHEIADFH